MFRHFPACSIIFHEKTWPHSPWHSHLPWPFHMPWRWPWDPGFRSGPSFRSSWSAWSKRPPAAELKKVGCIWRWSWLQLAMSSSIQITVYIYMYIYIYNNKYYIYTYITISNIKRQWKQTRRRRTWYTLIFNVFTAWRRPHDWKDSRACPDWGCHRANRPHATMTGHDGPWRAMMAMVKNVKNAVVATSIIIVHSILRLTHPRV